MKTKVFRSIKIKVSDETKTLEFLAPRFSTGKKIYDVNELDPKNSEHIKVIYDLLKSGPGIICRVL